MPRRPPHKRHLGLCSKCLWFYGAKAHFGECWWMRKRLQQGARGTGAVHLLHIFIREDCSFPAWRGERCSPNTDGEALPPHPSAPAGLFHEVPQTGPLAACRAISQAPSFLRTNADTSKPDPLQTAVLGFLSISSVQKEENMVEEIPWITSPPSTPLEDKDRPWGPRPDLQRLALPHRTGESESRRPQSRFPFLGSVNNPAILKPYFPL